jgi:hypothetical protein
VFFREKEVTGNSRNQLIRAAGRSFDLGEVQQGRHSSAQVRVQLSWEGWRGWHQPTGRNNNKQTGGGGAFKPPVIIPTRTTKSVFVFAIHGASGERGELSALGGTAGEVRGIKWL